MLIKLKCTWRRYWNVLGLLIQLFVVFFLSGFGIEGAAVVPETGVGNTWQRL